MEFQQFWEYWQHYQTFKTDLKKPDLSALTCTRLWSNRARLPVDPWHLTFVLGGLENLSFFIEIICWAHWISQVQSTGLPSIFLRAQPCCTCVDFLKARFRFLLVRWSFGLCHSSRNLRHSAHVVDLWQV